MASSYTFFRDRNAGRLERQEKRYLCEHRMKPTSSRTVVGQLNEDSPTRALVLHVTARTAGMCAVQTCTRYRALVCWCALQHSSFTRQQNTSPRRDPPEGPRTFRCILEAFRKRDDVPGSLDHAHNIKTVSGTHGHLVTTDDTSYRDQPRTGS